MVVFCSGDRRQRRLGDLATAGVEDRGAPLAGPRSRARRRDASCRSPHGPQTITQTIRPSRARRPSACAASRARARVRARSGEPPSSCTAARPGGARFEGRVLGQDLLLQALQLGARLDPDLLDQRRARLVVGLERLRLAPGAIEGEHALRVQMLSQRLAAIRASSRATASAWRPAASSASIASSMARM